MAKVGNAVSVLALAIFGEDDPMHGALEQSSRPEVEGITNIEKNGYMWLIGRVHRHGMPLFFWVAAFGS